MPIQIALCSRWPIVCESTTIATAFHKARKTVQFMFVVRCVLFARLFHLFIYFSDSCVWVCVCVCMFISICFRYVFFCMCVYFLCCRCCFSSVKRNSVRYCSCVCLVIWYQKVITTFRFNCMTSFPIDLQMKGYDEMFRSVIKKIENEHNINSWISWTVSMNIFIN